MAAKEHPLRVFARLAPRGSVTAELRDTVSGAFEAAGFVDVEWYGLKGDASGSSRATRIADPTLTVRLAGDLDPPVQSVAEELADALREIRATAASLPMGIEVAMADGLRRLSFALSDSPSDVAQGVAQLGQAIALGAPVVGWRARERKWTAL
jgi:hypothetical protein